MTRAFQYAGAHSVLAALWRVPDRPTARLMAGFYRQLQAGQPKAVALALAQRELFASPDAVPADEPLRAIRPTGETAPAAGTLLQWAAFQLYGDWR
jgi:CHAT domain-containing protein